MTAIDVKLREIDRKLDRAQRRGDDVAVKALSYEMDVLSLEWIKTKEAARYLATQWAKSLELSNDQ